MLSQPCTLRTTTNRCIRSSQTPSTGWISKPNNSRRSITNWSRINNKSSLRWARAQVATNSTTSCSFKLISRMQGVVAPLSAHRLSSPTSKWEAFLICSISCSSLITLLARKSSHDRLKHKMQTLTISTTTRSLGSQCWAQAKLTSINTERWCGSAPNTLIFLNHKLI